MFDPRILDYARSAVQAQIVGVVRNGKLNLGGTSGPDGGAGTPPGGFQGQLIQSAVAYDSTEAETLAGSSSLLDNLNHIRYRLASAGGSLVGIYQDGSLVGHFANINLGDSDFVVYNDGLTATVYLGQSGSFVTFLDSRYVNVTGDTMTGPLSGTDFVASGSLVGASFKLTTAPSNGYILTSDAGGYGSWQPNTGSGGGSGGISSIDFYQGIDSGSAFVGSGSVIAFSDAFAVSVVGGNAFVDTVGSTPPSQVYAAGQISRSAPSAADMDDMTLDYTITSGSVLILFGAQLYNSDTSGSANQKNGATLRVLVDGVAVGPFFTADLEPAWGPTEAQAGTSYLTHSWLYAPSSGSHNYKIQWQATYSAPSVLAQSRHLTLVNVPASGGGGGGSGDNSFAPTDYPNLDVWLKADTITGISSGSPIDTWVDSGPAGHNATQTTGSNQPLYETNTLNGLPVVRFDGTNDWMSGTMTASSTRTIYVAAVKRSAVTAASKTVFSEDPNAQLFTNSTVDPTTWAYYGNSTGASVAFGGSHNVTTWSVVTLRHISLGDQQFQVNGYNPHNQAAINPNDAYASGTTYTIGASQAGAGPGDYDIAEVLVYSGIHADYQVNTVTQYLNEKYAIW